MPNMTLDTAGEIIERKISPQPIESLRFCWRLLGDRKKKHYKSYIIKSRDCNPSRSVIKHISVLQNDLRPLLNTQIPELQKSLIL